MAGASATPQGTVYATAIAEAAEAAGGLDLLQEIGGGLAAVAQAWSDDRNLRAFFLSAVISSAKKEAGMQKLGTSLPKLLGHFLLLAQRRGRLALLPQIAGSYKKLLDKRLGRVPVRLVTAVPVAEDDFRRWTDTVRATIGGEPVVEHVVDPAIVAGAIIRVGDRVMDGSARRRLAKLKQKIIERGMQTHALQS